MVDLQGQSEKGLLRCQAMEAQRVFWARKVLMSRMTCHVPNFPPRRRRKAPEDSVAKAQEAPENYKIHKVPAKIT